MGYPTGPRDDDDVLELRALLHECRTCEKEFDGTVDFDKKLEIAEHVRKFKPICDMNSPEYIECIRIIEKIV